MNSRYRRMDICKQIQVIPAVFLLLLEGIEGSNSTATSQGGFDVNDTTTKFLISFFLIILMIFLSVIISFLCNKCLAKGNPIRDDESDISEFTKTVIRKRLMKIKWKRKEQMRAQSFFSRWFKKTKEHKKKSEPVSKANHVIKLEEMESPNNSKTSLSILPSLSNKVSDVGSRKSPEVGEIVRTDESKANGIMMKQTSFQDNTAIIRSSSNLNRNVALAKGTSNSITVVAARSDPSGSGKKKSSDEEDDEDKKANIKKIPSIIITMVEDSKRKTVTFKDQLENDEGTSKYNTGKDNANKTTSDKQSNLKKK